MEQFRRGELVFDVMDEGPSDGPVVVLLHGFPQFNTSWNAVIARLTAQGYRCLAPNQRGYSPGARPARRRDYRLQSLVEDVGALIDGSGAQRIHLVGHDWGANVAWAAAMEMPERLSSLVPMSVPHPAATLNAMATSRQALASWYIPFFQLPAIPERIFLGKDRKAMRLAQFARSKGQAPEAAERDARAMTEPGAFTAALNWYRAMPLSDMRRALRKVTVPTMFMWSEDDFALKEKGVRNCGRYVTGEYRFERLKGSHFLPDEQPDAVADLLIDWLAAHPIR
ncbi:alpha/beta hydrolase [Mycobacteriaceae bacterium 1482268.1]|nr:alpha/beta hydrolase [Mycobacteriaceae bacterium 1482268.1]